MINMHINYYNILLVIFYNNKNDYLNHVRSVLFTKNLSLFTNFSNPPIINKIII
jgi:hypothetical protein